jgi:predicted O-methyltransferase YrrM
MGALAWSFYGTIDARSAQVRDPAVLPLLALLHYLIRANGCIRVLETGTAKGVSAACLASAVAARDGGRVVTFDLAPHPERVDLWDALPPAISTCIEQRTAESLEGMAAALTAEEAYEAALLDSIHTEDHVWAEFQLATQLVCRGGLILIHDTRYKYGTVERALQRIEAVGYGVVRLWAAERGIDEDDHLGLAVIENRRRAC